MKINSKKPSMAEHLQEIRDTHEKQFMLTMDAVMYDGKFHPSLPRWLKSTWESARVHGASFNPFISCMFICFTNKLMQEFIDTIPLNQQLEALDAAVDMFHTYLDQSHTVAKAVLAQRTADTSDDTEGERASPVAQRSDQMEDEGVNKSEPPTKPN